MTREGGWKFKYGLDFICGRRTGRDNRGFGTGTDNARPLAIKNKVILV